MVMNVFAQPFMPEQEEEMTHDCVDIEGLFKQPARSLFVDRDLF